MEGYLLGFYLEEALLVLGLDRFGFWGSYLKLLFYSA